MSTLKHITTHRATRDWFATKQALIPRWKKHVRENSALVIEGREHRHGYGHGHGRSNATERNATNKSDKITNSTEVVFVQNPSCMAPVLLLSLSSSLFSHNRTQHSLSFLILIPHTDPPAFMSHLASHQHNYYLVETTNNHTQHNHDPTTSPRSSSSSSSFFPSATTHPAPPLFLSPSDCDQKLLIGPMLHSHVHNNINNSNHSGQKMQAQQHGCTFTTSSNISDANDGYMAPIPGCFPCRANKKRGPHSSMTKTLHNRAFCKSRRGSLSAPCLVSPLPPPSIEMARVAHVFGLKTTPVTTPTPAGASFLANEVLSLIFRNLMDRKSILNCSLVSTHWHGPARLELARIVQDMPFNGQGLLHAIRYLSSYVFLTFIFQVHKKLLTEL